MFKKLFSNLVGSTEEHTFVREVSSEIANLRHECRDVTIHEADQRSFSMATRKLTSLIAQGGMTPELKRAHPRTIAWLLISEGIDQIGVGDDPSRLISEKFYLFFENEKLKEIESTYGPASSW